MASKTGEEGQNKINENFPYYDIFDQTMGYRNNINSEKMEIESSSFTASPLADHSFPKLVSSRASESA